MKTLSLLGLFLLVSCNNTLEIKSNPKLFSDIDHRLNELENKDIQLNDLLNLLTLRVKAIESQQLVFNSQLDLLINSVIEGIKQDLSKKL